MNFFKCLGVLALVTMPASVVVCMEGQDYISQLPKPVIALIGKELQTQGDLRSLACFARANKKIHQSVKSDLDQFHKKLVKDLYERFNNVCSEDNLEDVDLRKIGEIANVCTQMNKSEKRKEDFESLNKRVLNFIQKTVTRQIKNCREAAYNSLLRLVKNGYDEAIVYAKNCVTKWKKAKRQDLVEIREKLLEILKKVNK